MRPRVSGRDRWLATRRLGIESLESREMLDAGGLAWTGASELTLSFAPDGTDVAGQPSSLFSEFQSPNMSGWQDAVVRAFETWARYTSSRVETVADSGDPFGTPGAAQGDPRFGDVRIAAVPLSSDVIAISVPHDEIVSGTWAGDILINSNADLANLRDLYSVLLHEAGHVFGLDHSSDPRSPMFVHGISQVMAPTAQDIARLRSIYGVSNRQESRDSEHEERSEHDERHESEHEEEDRKSSGESRERTSSDGIDQESSDKVGQDPAIEPRLLRPQSEHVFRYKSTGTITSADDVDYFQLMPGEGEAEALDVLSVTVQATDRAALIPQLDVFTRDGRRMPAEVLTNDNGTLILQVKDVNPGERYLLRVKTADSAGPYQSGGYRLEAQFVATQATLDQFFAETLGGRANEVTRTLHVSETTLAHFALSVADVAARGQVAVWAVIYNSQGDVVSRIAAHAGETRSAGTALLSPGDYVVQFRAARLDGRLLPPVAFELLGKTISLPIGPVIADPTQVPVLPSGDLTDPPPGYSPPDLAVTDPIIFPTLPPASLPTTTVIVTPPWSDPSWWYWDATTLAGTGVTLLP